MTLVARNPPPLTYVACIIICLITFLTDRVSDELWMEVCDIVQETRIKTILMEKKYKKAKWLSGEALQIAVKRREMKAKEKGKI